MYKYTIGVCVCVGTAFSLEDTFSLQYNVLFFKLAHYSPFWPLRVYLFYKRLLVFWSFIIRGL